MDSFHKIKDWNKWEQDNTNNNLQLIEKKKKWRFGFRKDQLSPLRKCSEGCVCVCFFIIFIENAGKESKDV